MKLKLRVKNIGFCVGVSDFQKVYRPRNNIVNDEKFYHVAYPHIMLVSLRKLFSQLLKVQGVTDVRRTNTCAIANTE